jgi:hypothetical protein
MYLLKRESLTGFNLKLKDQWGQYYQMYFNADFDVTMYADRLGDGRENGQNRTLSMRPVRLRP